MFLLFTCVVSSRGQEQLPEKHNESTSFVRELQCRAHPAGEAIRSLQTELIGSEMEEAPKRDFFPRLVMFFVRLFLHLIIFVRLLGRLNKHLFFSK